MATQQGTAQQTFSSNSQSLTPSGGFSPAAKPESLNIPYSTVGPGGRSYNSPGGGTTGVVTQVQPVAAAPVSAPAPQPIVTPTPERPPVNYESGVAPGVLQSTVTAPIAFESIRQQQVQATKAPNVNLKTTDSTTTQPQSEFSKNVDAMTGKAELSALVASHNNAPGANAVAEAHLANSATSTVQTTTSPSNLLSSELTTIERAISDVSKGNIPTSIPVQAERQATVSGFTGAAEALVRNPVQALNPLNIPAGLERTSAQIVLGSPTQRASAIGGLAFSAALGKGVSEVANTLTESQAGTVANTLSPDQARQISDLPPLPNNPSIADVQGRVNDLSAIVGVKAPTVVSSLPSEAASIPKDLIVGAQYVPTDNTIAVNLNEIANSPGIVSETGQTVPQSLNQVLLHEVSHAYVAQSGVTVPSAFTPSEEDTLYSAGYNPKIINEEGFVRGMVTGASATPAATIPGLLIPVNQPAGSTGNQTISVPQQVRGNNLSQTEPSVIVTPSGLVKSGGISTNTGTEQATYTPNQLPLFKTGGASTPTGQEKVTYQLMYPTNSSTSVSTISSSSSPNLINAGETALGKLLGVGLISGGSTSIPTTGPQLQARGAGEQGIRTLFEQGTEAFVLTPGETVASAVSQPVQTLESIANPATYVSALARFAYGGPAAEGQVVGSVLGGAELGEVASKPIGAGVNLLTNAFESTRDAYVSYASAPTTPPPEFTMLTPKEFAATASSTPKNFEIVFERSITNPLGGYVVKEVEPPVPPIETGSGSGSGTVATGGSGGSGVSLQTTVGSGDTMQVQQQATFTPPIQEGSLFGVLASKVKQVQESPVISNEAQAQFSSNVAGSATSLATYRNQLSSFSSSQGLRSQTVPKLSLYSIQRQSLSQPTLSIQKVAQPQIQVQPQLFRQSSFQAQSTNLTQGQSQSQSQSQSQAQSQAQSQLQTAYQLQQQSLTLQQKKALKVPTNKKTIFGFISEVREKGQFKTLEGGKPLSFGQALERGKEYVKTHISATFDVEPVAQKAQESNYRSTSPNELLGSGFTKPVAGSKIVGSNVFIQERGTRLGSLQERNEIQQAKSRIG